MRFEKNESNIRADIAAGITRSLNATYLACAPAKPQEPDFIANLVENLPKDIYNSLQVYAPQYQYAISGVFCHQKPIVDIGMPKRPELGDLLLVYIEENEYAIRKCNALLLQAKKVSKTPYIVPASDEHQLKLYEEWPTFKYARAGILNGAIRNIQPKTLNTGAQFLLLKNPSKSESQITCAYADKKLMPEKKLSHQIIDLMKFFTGRTFRYNQLSVHDDNWSTMICDLIYISGVASYNRRAIGKVNSSRLVVYDDENILEDIYISQDTYMNYMADDFVGNEAVSCLLIYAKEKSNGSIKD